MNKKCSSSAALEKPQPVTAEKIPVSKNKDMHIGEPGFMRKLIRRKKLESIFLFITSKCNSNCRTCFYNSYLNTGNDMSYKEIEKLSLTAPEFDKLWLSGGEPFLRNELAEIIAQFYYNNKIKSINLPTNGLATKKIEEQLAQLIKMCPELEIHLNFSLDGMGASHDNVRGVPGNFDTTTATMEQIERLYGDYPHLYMNVASVVTPEAYNELFDLGVYLFKKFNLAAHVFETPRGDTKDPNVKTLTVKDMDLLHDRVMPLYDSMAERLFGSLPGPFRAFARTYFIGTIYFMYKQQEANMMGPSHWGMKCTAGETTLVFDHDGGFRSCELRPRIGMARDYDFNTKAIYNSQAMRQEISDLGGGVKANCWCTHGCWIISSLKFSPRTLLFRLPGSYFKLKKKKLHPFDPSMYDIASLGKAYNIG